MSWQLVVCSVSIATNGMLAAAMMDTAIEKARKAQGSGDILEMMPALKELQEFEL